MRPRRRVRRLPPPPIPRRLARPSAHRCRPSVPRPPRRPRRRRLPAPPTRVVRPRHRRWVSVRRHPPPLASVPRQRHRGSVRLCPPHPGSVQRQRQLQRASGSPRRPRRPRRGSVPPRPRHPGSVPRQRHQDSGRPRRPRRGSVPLRPRRPVLVSVTPSARPASPCLRRPSGRRSDRAVVRSRHRRAWAADVPHPRAVAVRATPSARAGDRRAPAVVDDPREAAAASAAGPRVEGSGGRARPQVAVGSPPGAVVVWQVAGRRSDGRAGAAGTSKSSSPRS